MQLLAAGCHSTDMRDRYMDYSDRRTSDMTARRDMDSAELDPGDPRDAAELTLRAKDIYCPWCTDGRDKCGEGESFCRAPGCKPDRPDYDGGRTDGAALTDAPVYVEHGTGEDDGCGAVLGLSLTVYPDPKLMVDLSTGDNMNEPDLRDGVLEVVERTLADRYTTNIPEGYSVEVRLSGDGYMWDRVNQRAEVFVEVEFYGGLYRGDESGEDWCGRIVKNCPYHKVYNEMWVLYTAQRIVEDALRAHLGMRPMCRRCDGSGTEQMGWAPYEQPCERCDTTGDEPE